MARRDDSRLTRKDRQIINAHAPEEIRQFVDELPDDVGERAAAFRKVAAIARSEREALLEVRALELVRLSSDPAKAIQDAQSAIAARDRRIAALEGERAELVRGREIATARPALAVHSDD